MELLLSFQPLTLRRLDSLRITYLTLRRRWSKNHAEKYSREHGLDLDIQKQYARVSALVQMITIAKELEGITPLESAQIKKKWTNKLKGKLGNSTRQTAFGKWLGRRSGAAEKNVVGETWVLAKITEHDLQYFQRQVRTQRDHVPKALL